MSVVLCRLSNVWSFNTGWRGRLVLFREVSVCLGDLGSILIFNFLQLTKAAAKVTKTMRAVKEKKSLVKRCCVLEGLARGGSLSLSETRKIFLPEPVRF